MRLFNSRFRVILWSTICASMFGTCAFSATTKQTLSVVPWNGYSGAVSLTFDDGDPTQINYAVPELNKRKLRATFFLISNDMELKSKWQQITKYGHEIGSHTYSHQHPQKLTQADLIRETKRARVHLSHDMHCHVYTLAYPYFEVTAPLKTFTAQSYFAARGGSGLSYMRPTDNPDWYDMPSQTALSKLPLSDYTKWIDTAEKTGTWTIFTIHAIKGGEWGWQPLTKPIFTGILSKLQTSKVWTAPFGTICRYWKAQKIVEKSRTLATESRTTYKWQVPAGFPTGTKLKVLIHGAQVNTKLFQYHKQLTPDINNVYKIDFDAGELVCKH